MLFEQLADFKLGEVAQVKGSLNFFYDFRALFSLFEFLLGALVLSRLDFFLVLNSLTLSPSRLGRHRAPGLAAPGALVPARSWVVATRAFAGLFKLSKPLFHFIFLNHLLFFN